jgi:iron complex outermembrane receptor protein
MVTMNDTSSGTIERRRCFALLAGTVLAFAGTPDAFAQPASPSQAGQQSISIPAGPLTPALNRLAAQAGLQILFDAELTRGKATRGVSGARSPAQALEALLAGTGVSARFAGTHQVMLSAAPTAAAAPGGLPASTISLDEITIYGARDATTLGSTSASVGVVTAKDIELGQIRTTQDSYRRLGNVDDSAFLNSGFVIRGMGSEGFVPSGAPVGSIYVDGILQPRYSARFGTRNLWDAEQVEVYRGPQSTLSGRAAMAGAIYVKTKDPTFEKKVEIAGTVGNNRRIGTAFMVNTPVLDDQIALRIAGSFERARTDIKFPTYRNFRNYDDLVNEISYNLRAKLLITPRELSDTKALLSYSYSNERPQERLIGDGPRFGLRANRGDWRDFATYNEYRAIKTHNLGLEVTHNFSDRLKLTSQTGLHYGVTRRLSVDTGTPGLRDGLTGKVQDTLFTQELRLNYEGDRWKWVAGVFGSYQNFDSTLDAAVVPYLQLGERFNRKTSNLAAFGEASYEFFPTLKLTLGGRVDYLREKTEQHNSDTSPYGGIPFNYSNRANFNEVNFVPKIALSKDITDKQTVGIMYSEGFRTGGFYVNYKTGAPAYYDPEQARNYELFYKGRFLEDRLTLNANLFFTKYRDQQIEIRPDPNNQSYRETTNAANSRVWGFEIEPSWRVDDRFSVFASIGYLNTKFEKFDHAAYGDLSGKPFPEAPKWTIGFGGRYEFENGFYVGADAKYTASYTAKFGLPPLDTIASRIIVNAQAGYRRANWEINAFAENLFDERYYTFIDRDAVPAYAQLGQGRTVGVTVKAKF